MKQAPIFILLLLFLFSWTSFAADTDMVVLLDTSVSVLPIYEDLQQHLLRGILESQMHSRDHFHLISFADFPEIEISREIREDKQIEEILAYAGILQPMGQYTDLLLALMFLQTYVEDLSLVTEKNILILTDGVHDPPPDSPFYGLSAEMVESRIAEFSRELRKKGWEFHVLALNGQRARQDLPSHLDTLTKELGVQPAQYTGQEGETLSHTALGVPRVTFPEELGEVKYSFQLPLQVKNFSGEEMDLSIQGVLFEGVNILRREVQVSLGVDEEIDLSLKLRLPETLEPGSHRLALTLLVPDGMNIAPLQGTVNITLLSAGRNSRNWRIVLILTGVLVVLGGIFLVARRLGAGFSGGPTAKPVSYGRTSFAEDSLESEETKASEALQAAERYPGGTKKAPVPAGKKATYPVRPASRTLSAPRSKSGERPLELLVTGQSRLNGLRNILTVPEDSGRSLGGRGSGDFMIFIAPFPKDIARIVKKGGSYSLEILEPRYFPGESGTLYDCLNKNISLIAENGEEISLYFREWISPLERVNRILHLTDEPGLPNFDY
ncbi:MAG: VWA domain-containing protein [Spirochaetales bacterium]|nr:VWA domain-containing protein [Spirochaetales bacterium]